MMRILIFFILISFSNLNGQNNNFIFDHSSVAKFKEIDEQIISKAIEKRVMFRHASVGTTINNGLECVQGTRTNPKECTTYEPYYYDRRQWRFQPRGNSGWKGKIDEFVNEVNIQLDSFDIFSFKFCYLDGLDGLAEPCGKSFDEKTTEDAWNYLKNSFESLEQTYPNKKFIWWTIPLTQVGQYCTERLNKYIRDYAKENNKILFDIADIQCWDTLGTYLTNNQGWEIAFKGYCGEQQPGAQACHPNWLNSIMLAKAYWVMITDIAKNDINHVEQLNNFDIDFYPNPVDEILRIEINKQKYPTEMKIRNIFGKIVYGININPYINNYDVDVSNFYSGLYILELKYNDNSYCFKFIKN
jgi:hypothetical protein